MKNRYGMTSSDGEYVEHSDREFVVKLRKRLSEFKGKHIKCHLQAWDDVVIEGRIYPHFIQTRFQFRRFNIATSHNS